MERDSKSYGYDTDGGHFNSHAHVERDWTLDKWYGWKGISTHTLTWSVTERRVKIIENKVISTHTLTWSVTQDVCRSSLHSRISTHTLTWSVTNLAR